MGGVGPIGNISVRRDESRDERGHRQSQESDVSTRNIGKRLTNIIEGIDCLPASERNLKCIAVIRAQLEAVVHTLHSG